jgi:hypothetical protein
MSKLALFLLLWPVTDLLHKSVKINGKPWKSNCFLEWDTFVRGGIIELELTDDITIGCGELPPSLSTGGYDVEHQYDSGRLTMPNGEPIGRPIMY